ncbi:hypothetical protein BS78_K323300 [Paspalum vaginatum]|uniref:Uncharacterized protein n=1 Tax=Paspalum vaginatum TaxID=158149 RepID=A0A9W8CE44_9POAL|nr:hypothetical protein BS78_K323300 [Paspalum vaginatum]
MAEFADCIFNEEHFPALGGDFKYQKECREIDWDAKSISSSDPYTKETELQVQKIIGLQNIANNLPDAFTNYNGVIKFFQPAKNASARVEVPIKTTQPPISNKRGRSKASKPGPSKQKKTVNAHQPVVDVSGLDPQPSSAMRIAELGTSENSRIIDLGNNDNPLRVNELATNYIETGKSFDRKATIVDAYFSEEIVDILNDPDPRTMSECKKRSDWNQWKEAIETEIASLYKR